MSASFTAPTSNARRSLHMTPGTPWWEASERLRRVLDRSIGLTGLRVTRDFYGVTATYDALSCDEALKPAPATVAVPLQIRGQVIGTVVVQDSRRTFFDADAHASAMQIVAAHADQFEDPSARVRAQKRNEKRR